MQKSAIVTNPSVWLSRLRLTFAAPELEAEFVCEYDDTHLIQARYALATGILLVLMGVGLDGFAGPEAVGLGTPARFFLPVLCSGLVASFHPHVGRTLQRYAAAWCVIAGAALLGSASMPDLASGRGAPSLVGLYSLALIAALIFAMLGLRFRWACLAGAGLLILLLLFLNVSPMGVSGQAFHISWYLAAAILLAVIAAYWRERRVRQSFLMRRALESERTLSNRLLYDVMPERIARRIRAGEFPIADPLDDATVVFLDLAGFTAFAARVAPAQLVEVLNEIWTRFDDVVEGHGLEKLKTVGDAYVTVTGGTGNARLDAEMTAGAIRAAAKMISVVREIAARRGCGLDARVGIHTGPVVAGVVGRRRYQFDVWGDTVNVASRLEEMGAPGRIHVSQSTHQRVSHRFDFEARGGLDVKGKGQLATFLFVGEKPPAMPFEERQAGTGCCA